MYDHLFTGDRSLEKLCARIAHDNSETEHAWAAGIVDGEGCVYIARSGRWDAPAKKRNYSVVLAVKMTSEPTIDRLGNMFAPAKSSFVPSRRIGHKDAWQIRWSGTRARRVLASILPYSVTKRREIELALQYEFLMTHKGRVFDKEEAREIGERFYFRLKQEKMAGANCDLEYAEE